MRVAENRKVRWNGPAIRAIREHAGIRSGDLARAAGISAQHIVNIERGVRQPAEQVGLRIAKTLGVSDLRAITDIGGPQPVPVDGEKSS